MKILVTGSAGFIGSALTIKLLELGHNVLGIDNHNSYYDPSLKLARLERQVHNKNYTHLKLDISESESLRQAFTDFEPEIVVNLAAQAGVRYSIKKPLEYVKSNIYGFVNILECCNEFKIKHLIYASSSSVYGKNTKTPYSIADNVDFPISVYAASKRSNELLAHVYSSLYALPTTGLRFFTVYGPWGRPDMALFKFTESILSNKPIDVYNYGNHTRDFTYIDDVVEGLIRILNKTEQKKARETSGSDNAYPTNALCRLYNIGNNNPMRLLEWIKLLENSLGKKALVNLLPLQPGDVIDTYADVSELIDEFDYKPQTPVEDGLRNFVEWYIKYNS